MSRDGRCRVGRGRRRPRACSRVAWAGLYEGVGSGAPAAAVPAGRPAHARRAGAPRAPGRDRGRRTGRRVPMALALATRGLGLEPGHVRRRGLVGRRQRSSPTASRPARDASLPVSPADAPALVALLDAALVADGRRGGVADRRAPAPGGRAGDRRRRPRLPLDRRASGLRGRWPGALGAGRADRRAGAVGREPGRPPRARCGTWAGRSCSAALAVAVAAGLGTGPAKAGDPWWAWKEWDIGAPGSELGRRRARPAPALRHARLARRRPRVAFSVATDRARPLRAVSLAEFDGVAFTLGRAGRVGGAARARRHDRRAGCRARRDGGDAGRHAGRRELAGGRRLGPSRADHRRLHRRGRPRGRRDPRGHARCKPGDEYRVRTRIPQPRPADLVEAEDLRAVRGSRGQHAPAPAPTGACRSMCRCGAAAGTQPDDALLGPYAEVRTLTRRVVGDAATPYAAVNRIEAYLRGDYVYDEQPPFPTSLPDDWPGGRSAGSPAARRLPAQQPPRLLPALRRLDGRDAALGGHPGAGGGGLHRRHLRLRHRPLPRCSTATRTRGSRSGSPATAGCRSTRPRAARPRTRPRSRRPTTTRRRSTSTSGASPTRPSIPPATPTRLPPRPRPARRPTPAVAGGGGAGGGGGPGWRWALAGAPRFPLGIAPGHRALRRFRGGAAATSAAGWSPPPVSWRRRSRPLGWAPPAAASPSERARGDPRADRGRPLGALPARRPAPGSRPSRRPPARRTRRGASCRACAARSAAAPRGACGY